jgi:hypothetical protein
LGVTVPRPSRFAVVSDGNRFSGGWRPNPDAAETINVPFDIGEHG